MIRNLRSEKNLSIEAWGDNLFALNTTLERDQAYCVAFIK